MKKYIFLSLVLLSFSFAQLVAQDDLVNKFEAGTITVNSTTLVYRIYKPENYDPLKKYPLILALHGNGERGSDNLIHIQRHGLATSWVDSANQQNNPCFVLAPQCPLEYEGWWTWSVYTTTIALLDSTIKNYPININQLYLTGLSAGGWGVFMFLKYSPGRFAAAIPMSGGWTPPEEIKEFLDVPVWDFHGQSDNLEPVNSSRVLMEVYPNVVYTNSYYRKVFNLSDQCIINHIKAHSNPFYSECPNIAHGNWEQWFTDPMLHLWLFSKYRLIPGAIRLNNLNGTGDYTVLNESDTITWSSENPEDSVEIWFSPNNGEAWNLIQSVENSGSYYWDLSHIDDCSLGKIRLLQKSKSQNVYGITESKLFTVNNSVTNGRPLIKILTQDFIRTTTLNIDSLNLELLVADPEKDSVTINLLVSYDNGRSYKCFDSLRVSSLIDTVERMVLLKDLQYSKQTILKAKISDNASTNADSTLYFINENGLVSGIQELNDENMEVQIYPNPCKDFLSIKLKNTNQEATAYIFDLFGNRIKTVRISNITSINISDFKTGIYILILEKGNGEVYSKKFLKQ